MHSALWWCVHGWVAWVIRTRQMVDPSQIVDFCRSVFVL